MYVVSFKVDTKGYYDFEDYKNLNHKKVTFNTFEQAIDVIRTHLRTVVETLTEIPNKYIEPRNKYEIRRWVESHLDDDAESWQRIPKGEEENDFCFRKYMCYGGSFECEYIVYDISDTIDGNNF